MATFNGTPNSDLLYGTDVADEIHGAAGNDDIFGLSGDDVLYGEDGNDQLDGGSGGDAMDGGIGNDHYLVDDVNDSVRDADGIDHVRTTLSSYALGATIEKLTGQSADGQSLFGNGLANIITGGAGADVIDGGGGDDTYIVGEGDSVSDSGGGMDHVISSAASQALAEGIENLTGAANVQQTLTGNDLANIIRAVAENVSWSGASKTLRGGGGDDSLYGAAGQDRLDGGTGADLMVGGSGGDTYIVDDLGDRISETGNYWDTDQVFASVDFMLPDTIENLTGTSDSGQVLTGNGLKNELRGGAGADTFQGGLGNDIYFVEANDLVIESSPETDTPHDDGTMDEIRTSIQVYTLQDSIEKLTALDDSDKIYTGNFKLNTIVTGAGDDIIDGGAHGDRMFGGAGNDIYYVDEPNERFNTPGGGYDQDYDQVSEYFDKGIDEVRTSFDYFLGDNVENLRARAGSGPLELTGNSLDNVITGGRFDDALVGGLGDDRLIGGRGIDTAKYTTATGGVVVSLLLRDAQDTEAAGIDTLAGIENLSGSAHADILRGNEGHNKLSGGAGDDLLRGFGGNDQLLGGTGVDGVTYVGTESRVVIDLARSDAQNTGGAGIDLLNGIEDVTGSSFGDILRGSERANRIVGGDGADRLDGKAGADTIIGGAGADLITGGQGADVLTGGTGDDIFTIARGTTRSDSSPTSID
ncbi:MAG TPA: calcium-binding protein, partial [Allosphingosinicella sp.]